MDLQVTGAATARVRIRQLWRTLLRPPPKLSLSAWADDTRVLSPEASAEPGPWRTDRAPYLRGIMDACSDLRVRSVVWMACSQVGKTETVNNIVGYHIDRDPAPILVVQPTLEVAKAWSKDRLKPMVRDTPGLRGKLGDSRARDSGDTILHKVFSGGHLTVVGANSTAGLAARPIRIVLLDEIDRYPVSAGSEGDPVRLAEQRARTFWNRKIVKISTPTIKGESRIEREYERSDQRRFYVQCPHCEEWQPLRWPNVKWETDVAKNGEKTHHPETAAYMCESCATLIEERFKPQMLRLGEWRRENPDGELPGFHLNALYSPWVRWSELAKMFLEAKNDIEELQTFVNLQLGEPWEVKQGKFDPKDLAERRESWPAKVPSGVGMLTAGVDVHDDRLELAVKGWGAGEESWLIGHHRLYGDPQKQEVWARLEAFLTQAYEHEAGAQLRIRAVGIDSGHLTTEVYAFVKPRERRGVYAMKGVDSRTGEPLKRSNRANKYGVKLWTVGTYSFKDKIFARLQLERPGPGFMHFCQATDTGADAEYFAQFGAEVRVRERSGSQIVRKYKQIRERNEAIDLEVYATAALHTLGSAVREQLAELAEQLSSGKPTTGAKRRKRRVRSRGL